MRRALGMVGLSLGLALALAAVVASCGGSDICLGCDGNSTPSPQNQVTVTGDVNQILPAGLVAENIVVIVCVDFPEGNLAGCPQPYTTSVSPNGDFTRSRIQFGSLRVGFWIDVDEDRVIDPEDFFSELQDPDDELGEVAGGRTVLVQNTTVNFTTQQSEADIDIEQSASPTPGATATPAG